MAVSTAFNQRTESHQNLLDLIKKALVMESEPQWDMPNWMLDRMDAESSEIEPKNQAVKRGFRLRGRWGRGWNRAALRRR